MIKMNSRGWKQDEFERFEWAVNQHGRDYKKIVGHVKTRSYQAIVKRFTRHVKHKSAHKPGWIAWTDDEKQRFADAVR